MSAEICDQKIDVDLFRASCPNSKCPKFGLFKQQCNISVRGTCGKDHKPLLYCRICGKKSAATAGSAVYGTHLPVKTAESIVHHAAEGAGV
ncbi:MAG: hypothetical protein LBP22_11205 [Deltaproteobacteria bacterium]|nr:hypothetical protein [Deltaproteobacteria bacterium]